MQENDKNLNAEDFLKNLPVQSEDIGFQPDEMIECGKCARSSAPNRLKCMYCGAELEISAETAAKITPNVRKLENWENGFNLIYLPKTENIPAETAAQIAKLVGLER